MNNAFTASDGSYKLRIDENQKKNTFTHLNIFKIIHKVSGLYKDQVTTRISMCEHTNHYVIATNFGWNFSAKKLRKNQNFFDSEPFLKRMYKTGEVTCHDITSTIEGESLFAVGLACGVVHVYTEKRGLNRVFSIDKSTGPCIAIKWIPQEHQHLVVSFNSGHLYTLDCSLNNMNSSIYKSAQKVKSSKIKISSNVQFTKRLSNAFGPFFKENTNFKKDNPKKCLNNYKDCQFKKKYENHDSTEFNLDSLITVDFLSTNNTNPILCWTFPGQIVFEMEFCKNGTLLAVITNNSYLYIFDCRTLKMIHVLKSYFGNFLCLRWVPCGDGCHYIIVGGEDDMVHVYSLDERKIICSGEGHKSWVRAIKVDHTFTNLSSTTVRIGSVGEDGHLCFWEIDVNLYQNRTTPNSFESPLNVSDLSSSSMPKLNSCKHKIIKKNYSFNKIYDNSQLSKIENDVNSIAKCDIQHKRNGQYPWLSSYRVPKGLKRFGTFILRKFKRNQSTNTIARFNATTMNVSSVDNTNYNSSIINHDEFFRYRFVQKLACLPWRLKFRPTNQINILNGISRVFSSLKPNTPDLDCLNDCPGVCSCNGNQFLSSFQTVPIIYPSVCHKISGNSSSDLQFTNYYLITASRDGIKTWKRPEETISKFCPISITEQSHRKPRFLPSINTIGKKYHPE